MTRRFPWLLIICLSLALHVGADASQEIRILTPVEGAVARGSHVLFVYSVPAGRRMQLSLGEVPADLPDVVATREAKDIHHVRVPLTGGRVEIRLLDAVNKAEVATRAVTYVPPHLLPRDPAEASRAAFHTQEREDLCSGCHRLPESVANGRDPSPSSIGEVCLTCHPWGKTRTFLHGPVAADLCLACHDPDYAPSRFAQKKDQGAGCGGCHAEFAARVLGTRRILHAPVAEGRCTSCHDPHGGQSTAQLRQPLPELCLLCHGDRLALPVTLHLHGRLPCTDCHDPHGGRTSLLTESEGSAACAPCHPDTFESDAGHPFPGHPFTAEVDPSNPSRPMGCVSCHEVHGKRDVSQLRITEDEAAQRRFCRRCHR